LSDNSKFAAKQGNRDKHVASTLENAVYSPCHLCKENPEKPPLWQIKAEQVKWDEQKDDIIYHHAFLEMFGVPVAYSPYLSHPAPNVKRRSGFLAPTIGASSDLGAIVAVPYYWVISEDKDLTVVPTYIGKNTSHFLLSGEYRQRFKTGEFKFAGSVTRGQLIKDRNASPQNSFRGHVITMTRFNLNPKWRTGFDIERASDQTYLRKYTNLNLSTKTALVSKAYLEGFHGKNYASLEGYSFQGLRENDRQATTPFVLPVANYNYQSSSGKWGEYWHLDANAMALSRTIGVDMQRVSTTGGIYIPYTSSWGDVYTLGTKVRGDLYHSSVHTPNDDSRTFNYSPRARFFPQLYGLWRYPFLRGSASNTMIVEPIVGFVAAPLIGQHNAIPNEDSLIIEYNSYNLFSDSRFAGLDRIDGGSRANYGLNVDSYLKPQIPLKINLFFGQSYAFQKPRDYLRGTGLEKRWSDYVARLKLSYQDWIVLQSRLLMDRVHFMPRQNEFYAQLGKPVLNLQTLYTLLPRLPNDPQSVKGKQLTLTLNSQFHKNWNAFVTATRQLGVNDGGALSHGAGLGYTDECFTLSTTLTRTFFKDRDIKPGTTLLFRVVFKNIGEVKHQASIQAPEGKPESDISVF
jgi:LPS-assembly protein